MVMNDIATYALFIVTVMSLVWGAAKRSTQ